MVEDEETRKKMGSDRQTGRERERERWGGGSHGNVDKIIHAETMVYLTESPLSSD